MKLFNKIKLKEKIINAATRLALSDREGKDYQSFFNELDIILKI